MDEAQLSSKMQQALDLVAQEARSIRTGRATPALVEDIIVDAYGGQQRLTVKELASINAPDPYSLVVAPWDQSIIGDIKKGIEKANVGLTPVIAGEAIRINLPPLTQEDRENYIKLLHQQLEEGRVMIRQIRQEAMQEIRDAFEKKELSEDEKALQEKRVQEITDEFIGKIDELGKAKEAELRSL